MNLIKISLAIVPIVLVSSCTQFERFSTDKVLPDTLGNNISRLKITTNLKDVFIIPNKDCISISDNVFYINNTFPKRTTEGWSIWSGWSKAPFEENKKKAVGMPSISLQDLSEKYGVQFTDKTYISNEYKLEPNKAYTIFIKTFGKTINLLFNNPEDVYGFGMYFTPKANVDYQLIIQSDVSHSTHWTSATQANTSSTYTYSYKLFDITNSTVKRVDPEIFGRAFGCKK
ncbi:hypothetical protein ACT2CV_08825 [Pasteurellaceae bacterium 22721_9_1]